MKLPWKAGSRTQGGSGGAREVRSLQAHFDRVIPGVADEVGLDLVATTLGWHAGGVASLDLHGALEQHAGLFREQYQKLLPKRVIFPEQIGLYGPAKQGFWCCWVQLAQGLPQDREPLRAFLTELGRVTGAQGFLQARVADHWLLGRPTPMPTARLVVWDGLEAHGWQMPLEAEPPGEWQPYQGPPMYGEIAGYPAISPPRFGRRLPVDEIGRVSLLGPLCDWMGTQLGPALVAGKAGRLPAPEGFHPAVHEQTLAMQQWLGNELGKHPETPLSELALLAAAGAGAVDMARFSLRGRTLTQEAECWELLRLVAEAWQMQGFVYALAATLAVPGGRPRRGKSLVVGLLHQWDGLMMQEAWAPVQEAGVGPWQVRSTEQGATPALDGLCGYRMSDLQRRTLEQVQRGEIAGVALHGAGSSLRWCPEHGRHREYRCPQCGATGCSRCMTMIASRSILCRQCASEGQ